MSTHSEESKEKKPFNWAGFITVVLFGVIMLYTSDQQVKALRASIVPPPISSGVTHVNGEVVTITQLGYASNGSILIVDKGGEYAINDNQLSIRPLPKGTQKLIKSIKDDGTVIFVPFTTEVMYSSGEYITSNFSTSERMVYPPSTSHSGDTPDHVETLKILPPLREIRNENLRKIDAILPVPPAATEPAPAAPPAPTAEQKPE